MRGEFPGAHGVPSLGILLGIGAMACSPAERRGAPPQSLTPAELREDLDYLFRTLEMIHPDMDA